jgi:hypothetical protein
MFCLVSSSSVYSILIYDIGFGTSVSVGKSVGCNAFTEEGALSDYVVNADAVVKAHICKPCLDMLSKGFPTLPARQIHASYIGDKKFRKRVKLMRLIQEGKAQATWNPCGCARRESTGMRISYKCKLVDASLFKKMYNRQLEHFHSLVACAVPNTMGESTTHILVSKKEIVGHAFASELENALDVEIYHDINAEFVESVVQSGHELREGQAKDTKKWLRNELDGDIPKALRSSNLPKIYSMIDLDEAVRKEVIAKEQAAEDALSKQGEHPAAPKGELESDSEPELPQASVGLRLSTHGEKQSAASRKRQQQPAGEAGALAVAKRGRVRGGVGPARGRGRGQMSAAPSTPPTAARKDSASVAGGSQKRVSGCVDMEKADEDVGSDSVSKKDTANPRSSGKKMRIDDWLDKLDITYVLQNPECELTQLGNTVYQAIVATLLPSPTQPAHLHARMSGTSC